ncbi:MAG: ABC transporter ATP-binding protein [Pseudomonadota bacterium]
MLKLHGISRLFKSDEIQTQALNNINIEIGAGEFVAIMGPSGCGKSTLLNIIGVMDRPTSGDYFFNGVNVVGFSESRLSDIRKDHIGFIFQAFNLVDELSAYRNIELALLYHDVPAVERRQQVEAVMEKVGITHLAKSRPSQLSGGQQQRIAVARAIVARPALLLADEPTGNLDSGNGRTIMEILNQLNNEGTTIVMVTHNQLDADYAHRTINLFDGCVALESKRQSTG